jgi:hypothetical protein
MREGGRRLARLRVWIAPLLLAGSGCIGLLGLAGFGQTNALVGQILITPALIVGLVLGPIAAALGPDLARLFLIVEDGWPVLGPLGVVLVYFVPATILGVRAGRMGRLRIGISGERYDSARASSTGGPETSPSGERGAAQQGDEADKA